MVVEGRAVRLAIWVGLVPDRWGVLGLEGCTGFKSSFLWFLPPLPSCASLSVNSPARRGFVLRLQCV